MLKDFYDESRPIVTLEAFYGPKKHLIDKCIVLFSEQIYLEIKNRFECKQITTIGGSNGGIKVFSFKYKNEDIAFYLSSMGSAMAADGVIEVNHLTGANKFVMFGSCGSLDRRKTNTKIIVPSEAYRGEGMSFYFKKASDYLKVKNSDLVASILREENIPFIQGRVWTTDCMLRETVNLTRQRKEEGCIAVEMELAGVQAACDFYGFDLYNFLSTGDIVDETQYELGDLYDANHNIDKFNIALKIIEKI